MGKSLLQTVTTCIRWVPKKSITTQKNELTFVMPRRETVSAGVY